MFVDCMTGIVRHVTMTRQITLTGVNQLSLVLGIQREQPKAWNLFWSSYLEEI